MSKKYDVFLSHNSTDKDAVEHLARRLQDEGMQVFLDKWHLVPGEPWQEALEDALGESATVAVFIGPSGIGPWHKEEIRDALNTRVQDSSYRVIPVLLPGATMPERGKLPRFLSRLTWVDFRGDLYDPKALKRLLSGVHGVAPGPGAEPTQYSDESPYRGLEKFRPVDAKWFFGRESEIQQLVEKLKTTRFLAVLGPSGSGKSSLALAGLLPALERGQLSGSADWPVLSFTPTQQPLEELAVHLSALNRNSTVPELEKNLASNEKTLHLTVHQTLMDAPAKRRVLLMIDQFEEIFTLVKSKDEHANARKSVREAFFDNLLYAASVQGGRTIVVLATRADFLAKCAAYPELADRMSAFQFLVTPMVESQLREAIERPANKAGLQLEGGLADVILRDVADEPGGLPLLEHALLELWKRREGQMLTFEAYREIGAVSGALTRTADETYESFDAGQRKVAQRILLALVEPGADTGDTRRRAKLSELITREEETGTVKEVLHKLTDRRLVTTEEDSESAEPVVNVAHEALIRNWPRLRRWIDENRKSLQIQRRLREASAAWQENERGDDWLYSGVQLTNARDWAEKNPDRLSQAVHDFLEASQALGQREFDLLTAREREILSKIVLGMSDKKIAFALGIAVGTVKKHVSNILSKLGVASRTEAAIFAERQPELEATQKLAEEAEVRRLGEEQLESAHSPEPRDFEPLTNREREILSKIVLGMSDKKIAFALGIAVGTVKKHVGSILSKLGVASRTEAAIFAERQRLL